MRHGPSVWVRPTRRRLAVLRLPPRWYRGPGLALRRDEFDMLLTRLRRLTRYHPQRGYLIALPALDAVVATCAYREGAAELAPLILEHVGDELRQFLRAVRA